MVRSRFDDDDDSGLVDAAAGLASFSGFVCAAAFSTAVGADGLVGWAACLAVVVGAAAAAVCVGRSVSAAAPTVFAFDRPFVVASRALTADAAGCAGFVVSIGLLAAEN
jgi:sorbitol-specific phosphotransferase system component IIBC